MHARSIAALAALYLMSGAHFAGAADKPSDPQIAHIAYTAGVIDIEAAKQAIKKSRNKEVVAFARDMVRDHEEVNKQALALAKKLNVTPEDNATSQALGCTQGKSAIPNAMAKTPAGVAMRKNRWLATGLK